MSSLETLSSLLQGGERLGSKAVQAQPLGSTVVAWSTGLICGLSAEIGVCQVRFN
jgi:hypothetical protein